MLFRERTPRGIAGALTGLVEGTLLGCGALAVWYFLAGSLPPWLDRRALAGLAVLGGLVLALGRGISGRMAGAGVGCVVGIFLGLPVALLLPAEWDVKQTRGAAASKLFELSGPTLDGKQVNIADYRGKLVLVDFWATWCPPCVEEMPRVKAGYERYHEQGLEVIGVSLDSSRSQLETFVRANGLSWPQIFFATGDQQQVNPLADEHQVLGIPTMFLIDRDGRLITRDLRGNELFAEIGRHLDPKANGRPRFGPTSEQVIPVRLGLATGSMLLVGALAGALVQRRLTPGRTAPAAAQKLP